MKCTCIFLLVMIGVSQGQKLQKGKKVQSDDVHNAYAKCFKWFDDDRSRHLDMREFVKYMLGQNAKPNATYHVLLKRLARCDKNTERLLPSLFTAVNINGDTFLDMVEVKSLMQKLDSNNDRKIDMDEYFM